MSVSETYTDEELAAQPEVAAIVREVFEELFAAKGRVDEAALHDALAARGLPKRVTPPQVMSIVNAKSSAALPADIADWLARSAKWLERERAEAIEAEKSGELYDPAEDEDEHGRPRTYNLVVAARDLDALIDGLKQLATMIASKGG